MKTKIRFFVLLCCCASLIRADTCVWKISRGAFTLYLGGTFHLLRPQDFPLPPEFDVAVARSQALYFETDVSRLSSPEAQVALRDRGTYPAGQGLDQALTPTAWHAIQRYAEQNGLPVTLLVHLRPWMIVTTLASLELRKLGVTEEGVDFHYFNEAVAAGKSTHGLETFEMQLDYITHLGAGHESEMVLGSIEELNGLSAELTSMLKAWRTGDVIMIDRTMLAETRKKYPAIYSDLIVKRNRAWLPEIEALLKTQETEFVLVGAAHLAGPDGLLAGLRKYGCKVEPVQLN